jgi:hypothetical protein
VTRKISAWAGPVIGIAAVLCAAVVVAYASGTRVEISVPVAANIGGPTPIGSGAATPGPLNISALTLVHPTHPVEVLDGPDSSGEPGGQKSPTDDAAATTPAPATATHEREDAATPDAPPTVPSLAPTPSARPAQATDSWANDDPTRSPRPTSSGWTPSGTPSASPSTSHRHGDGGTDDGSGGASQPGS